MTQATGQLVVISGPSGSGKTTILNIVGGLDQPSVGEVWFQGHDMADATAGELTRYRRDQIGFVFQFYNLVPNLTARENVLVSTEIASQPLDVDEILDRVGLTERKNHFPAQLSGGEQQRVAIARAVAKNPQILLCDEPTGNLDSDNAGIILDIFKRLHETSHTIVLVTHDQGVASHAQRRIHVQDGAIVDPASPGNN